VSTVVLGHSGDGLVMGGGGEGVCGSVGFVGGNGKKSGKKYGIKIIEASFKLYTE
jgi:hypothetical protein